MARKTAPRAGAKAASPSAAKSQPAQQGRGWHGDPERHAQAGRKGGMTVSLNRQHMAEIGKKGGMKVSQDRQHMATIGKIGGAKVARKRKDEDEGDEAMLPR